MSDRILDQIKLLTEKGVAEIFPNSPTESLQARLSTSDRSLRIKLGIDPTRPDLHLGHTVALRKLRAFQDAGHVAVLIIGDFTAQIGDPTGKSEARPRLMAEDISNNAKTYLDQALKILDFDTLGRLEVHRNSKWLSEVNLQDIIGLLSSMTVGQMLKKEDFGNRYKNETPIYLHEFLYPLLQGYDSVAVKSDVELGGTDQKFNILTGRDLQYRAGKALQVSQGLNMTLDEFNAALGKFKPKLIRDYDGSMQFGMLLPLLVGLDGVQKMSKSLDNYVGLTEDPLSMYSKLEKVPDALVPRYFELLTDVDLATLPTNPRERQKLLALTITSQYHSPEAAQQAQQDAEKIVLSGNTTDLGQIPEFAVDSIAKFPVPLAYLLKASGMCSSNNEAKSQITNGGVRLDGEKIQDVDRAFASAVELAGKVLQVGKKKFLRLV